MKPSKIPTLVLLVASLACGSAIADPLAASGDLSAQASSDTAKPGGFTTKAKLALLYGFSQTIRSVNVSSVTNPSTGVYCITPSVKLNFKNIYPQVSVERSLSTNGTAFWAYWVDTTNSPINCTETQIEVITDALNGTAAVASNFVGFDITVQ